MWKLLPDELFSIKILEARDQKEIQLMIDFDNKIWWRRDLNGEYELGL